MRKGFSQPKEKNWQRHDTRDYSLGNLDLVNLRLNLPPESPTRFSEEGSGDSYSPKQIIQPSRPFHRRQRDHYDSTPNHILRAPQGHEKSPCYNHKPKGNSSNDILLLYSKNSSKKVIQTEPISRNDFLYPSAKKVSSRAGSNFKQDAASHRDNRSPRPIVQNTSNFENHFPFKLTPSGNLKVSSSQVVFSSKKLSILVADPETTKINTFDSYSNMNHPQEFARAPPGSTMETLISHVPEGFNSLGSLFNNSPARSPTKEGSEYETKQTHEILHPEIDLERLGYCAKEEVKWDKVKLPEKQNLYLELYHRITNHTNADCKVFIDGEELLCHLIVLQSYSELFDAYVAVKKVELPSDKCSITTFQFIYNWMITGEPSYVNLRRENVLNIFVAAKYLKIKDLVEQCWAFIDNVDVFNEDTAFLLYVEAKSRCLTDVKELMLPRIQSFFLTLVSTCEWLDLDVEDVKNLLSSNYVSVNCEMEIFMSAVRWLKKDWNSRDRYKYEVLECVRFGNIAPWQLVDIKRNPENPDFMELAKDLRICKMIDDGLAYVIIKYWYGQEHEDFQHWNTVLALQEPPARNWSGPDKTYFTYREFLIFLDQYRRIDLIEKSKFKLSDKSERKHRDANQITEKNTPRVPPTLEEFMAKKIPASQKKINKVVS